MSDDTRFYVDVPGSPFAIGDRVRIVNVGFDGFEEKYEGHVGTVVWFEYGAREDARFPYDPQIGVLHDDGEAEMYWRQELVSTPPRPCTTCWGVGEVVDFYSEDPTQDIIPCPRCQGTAPNSDRKGPEDRRRRGHLDTMEVLVEAEMILKNGRKEVN